MDANLTDDELRAELIALGQNVGPITGTTRKVWVKRLTALRGKAKKTTSKLSTPRKLVGLSSDESQQSDVDEDVAGSSKRRQPSPARGRSGKLSLSKSNTVPSRSVRSARSSIDSSSKSKPSLEVPDISPKKTRSLQNNKSKTPAIHLAECSESDGNSTAEEPMEDTNGNHSFRFEPVSSSRNRKQHTTVPSYLQSTVTGRRSLSDLRKGSGYVEVAYGNDSLPFVNVSLSSPARSMLSMGINTTPSLDQSMGNSYLDSLNMSTGQSYMSDDASTPQRGDKSNHVTKSGMSSGDQITAHGFKTNEDVKAYRYPQYISWGLLFSVTAIFLGIACIYLVNVAVHSKESASVNSQGQRALPANLTSTDRCIYSLLDHLSTVAGEAVCRSLPGGGQVALQDAKTNAQGSSNYGTWTRCLEALLARPEWGVRLLTEDGADAQKSSEVAYMESTRPNMPFTCRLRRSFQKLLILTGFILAALVCVAVAVYIVRFFGKRKEDAQRQFYDLVEEIMDTLQQHVSACKQNRELKPYLAIPHVRDMLIPPEERQKKKKLWESAVIFLEANESRIRTESQVIMGEEFLVWRWLPSVSETAPTTTSSGRVWQGQAFADTNSVKPHYSPTECLKVRNMFDACVEFGEEWPVTIQDAILEKCVSSCPRAILHIAVDKNSKEGCVYIKCESRESAGDVYKALHGWWFDGKLVTVKYLRAERYLERFPESSAFNRALTPSNNQMLSMAPHS